MFFMRAVRYLPFLAFLSFSLEGGVRGKAPDTAVAKEAPKSVAEVAKEIRPSIVKVTQVGREGPFGVGSGFVVGKGGLIATNRHVIGEARRIRVETSDGREHEVLEIVASDTKLDLAVLRVASTDLKPLELGDSLAAKQGDPIVAMGNPEGLTYSVVEGVISEPRREIEGQAMIQVAVPIEHGNSGGPLVDRHGRVLGVLTMKSARTENLGFAMPVDALRKLLDKPNPIPMERWLTIGVLNPRFWKTLLGAQWTQRAGMVNVTQSGEGFGGRSLCLWTEKTPENAFEADVTVRLNDEAGAAGLAFCADGGDRHYGFYPTGGRLRLTRFDGPDVFSWKILRELDSDAYLPGDWNKLRVRVEGARIRCFLNGREVIDIEDTGLRGGLAGLCKFRTTTASFKNFRIGNDLSESVLSKEVEASLSGAIRALSQGSLPRQSAVSEFLKDPEASRKLLGERRLALEREAAVLSEISVEVHHRAVRAELAGELGKTEADLLHCALLLSRHDNPGLDVQSYERGFEQMARELREDPELGRGTLAAVGRINRYLFEENGFHGSRGDYGNPSNSYLNEVLDDREGLPITLSVVYLELARRLGVSNVVGIPLPGRFMVGCRESESDPWLVVDVYEGGKLMSMEEAEDMLSEGGLVPDGAKRPASKRDIILRMIRNLLGTATEARGGAKQALPYLDLLIELDPEAARERLNRAMIYERGGERMKAAEDVRWLMEHLPEGFGEDRKEMLDRWLERLLR